MKERCDRRFQLHDLIVLVILAAMTFPPIIHRVVAARQLSRRQQCSVQLSHIALATLNYHSTFQGFPMGSGGTGGSSDQPLSGNANRLSAFVPILPFMEEQRLWESIANPVDRRWHILSSNGASTMVQLQSLQTLAKTSFKIGLPRRS